MSNNPSLAQPDEESQDTTRGEQIDRELGIDVDECVCVLPGQSCEICRREARGVYRLEETY